MFVVLTTFALSMTKHTVCCFCITESKDDKEPIYEQERLWQSTFGNIG